MTNDPKRSIRERFPSVERLERWYGSHKRIPYLPQQTVADCGPACVAMVLGYHGREVTVSSLRDELGSGRDGTNALALLQVARTHGLRGRALRLEPEDLDYLPRASILHWNLVHFVVLERVRKSGIDIVDPALGRRSVPWSEVETSFTGVALEFELSPMFSPAKRGRRVISNYLRSFVSHRALFARIVVASLFLQLFGLGFPVFTGAVVDRVVPRGDDGLLGVLLVGAVLLGVFSFVTSLLRSHLLLHLRTNVEVKMSLDFLEHMLRLPYSFFQIRPTGDLLARLSSSVAIRDLLTSGALSAFLDGPLVLGYIGLAYLLHPGMASVVLLLGVCRVLVYWFTRRRVRDLAAEGLLANARSSSYQVQMLEGIEAIKVSGAESQAVQHWSNLFVDATNVSLAKGRLFAVQQAVLGSLAVVSPLVVLVFGAHLVLRGELSLGTMLAMHALSLGFLTPLTSLVSNGIQLQTLESHLDRMEDVLERAPEQAADEGAVAVELRGALEVRNVSFRYNEFAPSVLDDVSLAIHPGETVALVGRSGSGKSTLARLLVALYRPDQGDVYYDGRSLGTIELPSLREQIGFVAQEPYLFGATVAANIAIGRPGASQEEIERAATLAGIHSEIETFPMGYDTHVAARGVSLSGGQRQRIALARALLQRPKILVLDEATSHLDGIAERIVVENLDRLDSTRVLIAHRLSTIARADRVFVLEGGRVAASGTHEDLLSGSALYRELLTEQLAAERKGARA